MTAGPLAGALPAAGPAARPGAGPAAGGGPQRRGGSFRRRWLPWVLIALGLVVLVALAPRGGSDIPLDPRSPAAMGTKGLVDVLDELATAEVASSPEGADTALLLRDQLDDVARADLLGWVEGGGTLVVADPFSRITDLQHVPQAGGGLLGETLPRNCGVAALREADQVLIPDLILFTVPDGATGCFTRDDGAWLVLQPHGAGTIVRLGGPEGLVNQRLGDADNAVVAAGLLAPTPDTRAVVLDPLPGGGQASLTDLVHPRIRSALLQLAVAFVVLAAWRARRLGRPVTEPQPVRIPASELVVAVGNLLQRSRRRERAAAVLAEDLRRTLCERLGLPPSMRNEDVAAAAAARTGIPRDRVLAALAPRAPADEADLVNLSHTVEVIRNEVLHAK